jgi:hypothetical protein
VLAYSFDDGQAQMHPGTINHGTVEGAEAAEGKFGQALKFVGGPTRCAVTMWPLHWTEDLPLWARALVLADGRVVRCRAAGSGRRRRRLPPVHLPPVQEQLAEQAAAFAGQRGGLMHAVSATDGRMLGRWTLDAPPVFDGMAAAAGRLYLTTESGPRDLSSDEPTALDAGLVSSRLT